MLTPTGFDPVPDASIGEPETTDSKFDQSRVSARFDKKYDSVDFHSGGNGNSNPPTEGPSDLLRMQNVGPEPMLVLFFEVLFPFMVAGIGMVFAGLVLDRVQHWNFFQEVPQTFILVPALLGLKGNLEMTLASRLSTQANTGKMETSEQINNVVISSIALIETQALIVTFMATGAAMVIAWVSRGDFSLSNAVLLGSAAASTASVASLFLSVLMIGVVLGSQRYRINPDNVATPIAAMFGDLTTLTVLALFGRLFLNAEKAGAIWFGYFAAFAFFLAIPLFALVAWRDESSREVLLSGWTPIILAMLISSSGGFILQSSMKQFKQLAVYQPVINGVGGNLAAVAASKLSTYYHVHGGELGVLPNGWTLDRFTSIRRAFFSADSDSRAARVLLFLVVPGHMFFNWLISVLHPSSVKLLHHQHGQFYVSGPLFTALYLTAALAQVAILLFVTQWLVAWFWKKRFNPDNTAIPYLTAFGDLLGTLFLYIAFLLLAALSPADLHGPGDQLPLVNNTLTNSSNPSN